MRMTTERDIRNQIAYAEEKGMEKGMEKERTRISAKLREQGFSEEMIARIVSETDPPAEGDAFKEA